MFCLKMGDEVITGPIGMFMPYLQSLEDGQVTLIPVGILNQTGPEQKACSLLIKPKALQVAPNKGKLTRPTRDSTGTVYTGKTVPVKTPCAGVIIKKYRDNQNWHAIEGRPGETAICGYY